MFTRALRDLPSGPCMRPHSPSQPDRGKKTHPNPIGQVACSCRGHLVWLFCFRVPAGVWCIGKAAFFKSSQNKTWFFRPQYVFFSLISLVSARFVLLLQSVTELHAQLCWSKSSSALAIFFSEANTYTKADTVLPASAKSPQLCAEPLLFLGGTLMLEAALCGHFMAGIEQ